MMGFISIVIVWSSFGRKLAFYADGVVVSISSLTDVGFFVWLMFACVVSFLV